jgi:hypothetical protein
MTSAPNRRDALRKIGLAGSLIAIPGVGGMLADRAEAGVCALPPADPIFALIERHRAAQVIAGNDEIDMSDEEIAPFLDAEIDAFGELIDTPPTTLEGAIAFVSYLPEARGNALRLNEDESERAFAALLIGLRTVAAGRL